MMFSNLVKSFKHSQKVRIPEMPTNNEILQLPTISTQVNRIQILVYYTYADVGVVLFSFILRVFFFLSLKKK